MTSTTRTPSRNTTRTFLYAAVAPLLGNGCPGLQKMALYRFVENTLKPLEVTKTEVLKNGIFHHSVVHTDTEKVSFCGTQFSLHKHMEWDGTPQFPNGRSMTASVYVDLE